MKSLINIDMKPLTKALNKVIANTDKETLGRATLAGLFTFEAYAKLNIKKTFNQQTGFLGSAFETVLDSVSNTNAEGHTGPLAVYGRIQELGGVIRATNAQALVFQTDDGEWHRVKAVTIPARPYMRPAADEHQNDIFDAVGTVLGDAIEGNK